MDLELEDRTVFVAGSSRGIGYAVAEAFLDEGARVVISGRDRESLDRASSALGEGRADRLLAADSDLSDQRGIDRALDAGRAAFGRFDVVVANVGDGRASAGWDVERAEWEAVLDCNLLAGLDLARRAIPDLIARRGTLVMTSSIGGSETIGAPIAYAAAKAALNSAVARWLGHWVRAVFGSMPWCRATCSSPLDRGSKRPAISPNFGVSTLTAKCRSSASGGPRKSLVRSCLWLRRKASFITGAALVVDGGQTRTHG